MALSSATLYSQLFNIAKGIDETAAINAFAAAYTAYFYAAVAGAVPVTPGSLTAAELAMKTAMAGLKSDGTKIASGITAFWNTILAAPGPVFAGTTTPGVVPSGLAGLGATILATGQSNTTNAYDKPTSVQNVANDIHNASTGPTPGTVTLAGSPVNIS